MTCTLSFLVTIFATISKLSSTLDFFLPKVVTLLDFCFHLNIGAGMEHKNMLLENAKDLMGSEMTKRYIKPSWQPLDLVKE